MASFFRTLAAEPRKLALRGWVFQVHLWAGIGVGLYILAMSVSGSALVFREEFEAAYPGSARTVAVTDERASLEQVRAMVANRFPDYKVAWIREPDRAELAHDVWFEKGTDARLALVNPYGPRFLGEVGPTTTFWTFLQDLHFYLFAGRTGFLINGIGGLLLGLLCMTGLFIWWPGKKGWAQALRVNWKAGWKRLNWDLHSAGGAWILILVATWAVTGTYFAFPQPFMKAVGVVSPITPEVPSPHAPAKRQKAIPVDTLVAQARLAVPGRPTWIGLPHHEGENLAIVQLLPENSRDRHETVSVYMNPFTAKILEIRRPEDARLGDRILSWFVSLHFGNFGGWPVKALWAVMGLTPALLFVTGFLMWWNRVLSKRWRRWRTQAVTRPTETTLARS